MRGLKGDKREKKRIKQKKTFSYIEINLPTFILKKQE